VVALSVGKLLKGGNHYTKFSMGAPRVLSLVTTLELTFLYFLTQEKHFIVSSTAPTVLVHTTYLQGICSWRLWKWKIAWWFYSCLI